MAAIQTFNSLAVSPPLKQGTPNQWRDIRRVITITSSITFLQSKNKY